MFCVCHASNPGLQTMQHHFVLVAALAATILPATVPAADDGPYLRGGLGLSVSRDTRLKDEDCSSTVPPALFGCANGPDGVSIGARGDFSDTPLAEVALGYSRQWLRVEAVLSWRPSYDFDGQANFLNVPLGQQPVSGKVDSLSLMGAAYVDLAKVVSAWRDARIQPYVGAAVGAARNETERMTYRFPSIGAEAVTITPDGSWSGLAYSLTAGVSIPLGAATTLDVAYRYVDLGRVETDVGVAAIRRPSTSLDLTIAPTRADLRGDELLVSLRHAF
jgi:opacity protein-like surface antigen